MAKKKQNITINDLIKLGPKKLIIFLVLAGLLYFVNGDTFFHTDTGTNTITNTNSDIVSGIISRVVDGDTAVVRVDGQDRRIRLLGVDTPETVHPNKPVQYYGKEASSFTKNALTNKRVWLEYDASPTDRYNRHLVYLWLKEPKSITEYTIRNDMFNAKLLLGGYAKVMIIKPNKRYEELFRKFQDEAKNTRKGLWGQ